MKIYVFGNPLFKPDACALKILPKLRQAFPGINFVISDPNENFPQENEKNITVLDAIIGINKPKIYNLDDLQEINKSPVSPHDYDLLMHLLLLKKLKKIDQVHIIGIPQKAEEDILLKIIDLIKGIKST